MTAYSQDLRQKVIEKINIGHSKAEISRCFGISPKTVAAWEGNMYKKDGLVPITGYQKGHSHKITDLEKFKLFVDENNDLTQKELAEKLNVSASTISRALKKIEYTRKKKLYVCGKG